MILVVDDIPENIFSLKTLLELHSFPTDTAMSGEEALKKILKNTYALIILDVQMPGMDGFEVAEAIAGYSSTKNIPIIFLSAANTEKRFITKGYHAGGIDYVTKPFDPDILLLKVKTFYRLYEQTRALNEMQDILKKEIEFRKTAQTDAQAKALELHSTLELIPQIAFTAKADGTIDFVNQRWFKYSTSYNEFPKTHPDDADINLEWQKKMDSKEPLQLELRVKKIHDDQYRYHLLRAIPVKEKDNVVKWVGTFTDIEEQKQASKQKDEFMSIASHELKTPLASIKAYVQLLERSVAENDKTKSYVERTLVQINKLNALITELLDISKIESGKMKFNKNSFNFSGLLSNAIEMMQQTYAEYHIVQKGSADVEIIADEIRIEQVIINYLTNAIKYSPENKKIEVHSVVKSDELVVGVKDFGIGIAKENQTNIFRKFYRVEDTAHRFQGLGIGLFICAEIIKRHDGRYWMESEHGSGSTFYFSIPISQQ